MDTLTTSGRYVSGGSRSTRAHLDSEWRELRDPLQRAILAAASALTALQDLPRPLYLNDRPAHRAAVTAFAEHLSDNLTDLLGDVLGPLRRRADEAGFDPDDYRPDRSAFDAAVAAFTEGDA